MTAGTVYVAMTFVLCIVDGPAGCARPAFRDVWQTLGTHEEAQDTQTNKTSWKKMSGALAHVPRLDTTVSGPIAHKYATLPRVVANLQPADVGRIFACSQDPMAFLPQWGLHVTDFCLGYCNNLPHKRTDGALPVPPAISAIQGLAHGSMQGSVVVPPTVATKEDKKKKRPHPVAVPPPKLTAKSHDKVQLDKSHNKSHYKSQDKSQDRLQLDESHGNNKPERQKRALALPVSVLAAIPSTKTESPRRKRTRR